MEVVLKCKNKNKFKLPENVFHFILQMILSQSADSCSGINRLLSFIHFLNLILLNSTPINPNITQALLSNPPERRKY
jgi:hypothetical protein